MGFSRQENWSGLSCLPPGDLPDSGIKLTSLTSPALAGGFFTTGTTWEVQGSTLRNPFNLITSLKTLFSNTDSEVLKPNTSTYVLWETIQPISATKTYFSHKRFYVPLSMLLLFQSLSHVQLFVTPWSEARQASLSFTISWTLLKLMSIESMMPSNHFILCPLLLLPSIFPSIRVFSNQSALFIRWLKYWSFSFSTSPSNEYSRFISFRIHHLAVQGTLRSLLQP